MRIFYFLSFHQWRGSEFGYTILRKIHAEVKKAIELKINIYNIPHYITALLLVYFWNNLDCKVSLLCWSCLECIQQSLNRIELHHKSISENLSSANEFVRNQIENTFGTFVFLFTQTFKFRQTTRRARYPAWDCHTYGRIWGSDLRSAHYRDWQFVCRSTLTLEATNEYHVVTTISSWFYSMARHPSR